LYVRYSFFEVKNRSPWAILHSFESVLEKHHCAETHRLLSHPDTDILASLSTSDRAWITRLITKAILSTDMALHCSQLEYVQQRLANQQYLDLDNVEADRKTLVAFLLHCAGTLLSTMSSMYCYDIFS
jgi:hypothetical protein